MRRQWSLVLIGLVVVLGACSVSEPRHGFTRSAAGERGAVVGHDTDAFGVGGESQPGGDPQDPDADHPVLPARDSGAAPGSGPTTTIVRGAGPGGPNAASSTGSTGGTGVVGRGSSGPPPIAPSGPGAPTTVTTRPAPAAPAVGVTAGSVTVSVVAGFGGPYGQIMNQVFPGFETAIDDINANGGVLGRRVVIKKVDHKETSGGGVAACKEVLSNGSYFAMVIEGQGEANITAADCLDKAGFPNASFVPDLQPEWRHTYTYLPLAQTTGRTLASFVKNAMGDGAKKLGVIYLNNPLYGKAKDAYLGEAKALGLRVVATEAVEVNQGSFTPQLLRLRNAGVENLALIVTFEALGILRDAKALNYQPHVTGFYWAYDVIARAAGPTATGARTLRFNATVDSPRYRDFENRQRHYGRSGVSDGESFYLWGVGLLLGRLLEAAGPNPTRATLESGIQSIRNYDNGVLAPLTYGPGDFDGAEGSFPAECCLAGGSWKGLGPARATF